MSFSLVFLLYGMWSTSFPIGKLLLEHAPPIFLTAVRMLFAGCILLIVLRIKKPNAFRIKWKYLLPLSLLGLFSIYLTNVCEFWGLQHLSAAKTCFIYSLCPFFSLILSYIHFKEKLNLKKCLGMLIGFAGFVPVLLMSSGSEELFSITSYLSWPELSLMGAAFFSVYGWIILRILVKKDSLSPLYANGWSMLIGGLMALAHSYAIDSWSPTPVLSGHGVPLVQGLLVITLISNVICYNFYGYLLKRFTATFLSFAGLLSPLFTSLNSWLILGEKPSPVILISTAIVSVGLYLVYQAELSQGYIIKKKAA